MSILTDFCGTFPDVHGQDWCSEAEAQRNGRPETLLSALPSNKVERHVTMRERLYWSQRTLA